MHEVPVVDVSLIVKSGAAADPAGKYGVASFTAAMLDEGAGTRRALELADAVDALGASLSTSSSFDASTVRLHALTSKLDAALPIMADVALRPDVSAGRSRSAARGTAHEPAADARQRRRSWRARRSAACSTARRTDTARARRAPKRPTRR